MLIHPLICYTRSNWRQPGNSGVDLFRDDGFARSSRAFPIRADWVCYREKNVRCSGFHPSSYKRRPRYDSCSTLPYIVEYLFRKDNWLSRWFLSSTLIKIRWNALPYWTTFPWSVALRRWHARLGPSIVSDGKGIDNQSFERSSRSVWLLPYCL